MKKISNDEYYSFFCQWRSSGISKSLFASREGISLTSFYYWCRKFEGRETVCLDSSGFSLVTPDRSFQKDPVIRISYPSGVSVEFFSKIDPDMIKRLL